MANLQGHFCRRKFQHELGEFNCHKFQRNYHVTPDLVARIGLQHELQGHNGCVNCLEWNERGTLLASGSDDVQVMIWDPFKAKRVASLKTGHTGNIFSVKFLPNSNDSILVSGAADCRILVHDLNSGETTQAFSTHAGRVKRLATAPNVPFMFWSAAEDGTVMQFDLRTPEACSSAHPKNVLINLNAHMGSHAEAKCLNINPCRPELLAVGANDPFIRVYDRRMLTCRGIKFTTNNLRFPWERLPTVSEAPAASGEDYELPQGCVQYYVAGHLPQKQDHYREKFRSLVSTYLTFSPDGNDLLVNLGGEQIYLFDINRNRPIQNFSLLQKLHSNGVVKEAAMCSQTNGFSKHCSSPSANGFSPHMVPPQEKPDKEKRSKDRKSKRTKYVGAPLRPAVEAIKQKANSVFQAHKYSQAILLYNQALSMQRDSPVLYGNRAAAYIKRNWDGDQYAALRDCYSAIHLDPNHLKAHFRLAKCLFELEWTAEALECLQYFKGKFPDYATSDACQSLERDITAAVLSSKKGDKNGSGPRHSASSKSPQNGANKRQDLISEQETIWQSQASDYDLRFCGHCNTTTDIKEANFFGSNGQYVVAGSDDGSFFIWDRSTTNIVRVLRGDDSIVNCLQPHPSTCLLATSGIDPVVRLWSPMPQDGRKDEREVDNSDDAASANQKRMNADPLEMMLMNMGYRITSVLEREDEEGAREGGRGDQGGDNPVQCRPS